MTRGFSAQHAARLTQLREHVAIADRRAMEFDAALAQRALEAVVAHQGADHRPLQRSRRVTSGGDDKQQLIAVDLAPEVIDHDQPVAIAIKCDTHLRLHAGHRQLQQVRSSGATAIIDVAAIRRAADRHNLCAEVGEDARGDLVACAVRTVDDDLHALERDAGRQGRNAEVLIRLARLVHARCPTQGTRLARGRRFLELRLNSLLGLIRELAALGIEELDAVVVVRIVRGADHHTEATAEVTRHKSDARCRQRADQSNIESRGDEPGLERGLEHVA